MLEKYGLDRKEAGAFCLVQVTSLPLIENGGHEVNDGREYYLEDDECPLAILMNHPPSRGTYNARQTMASYNARIFNERPPGLQFYPHLILRKFY